MDTLTYILNKYKLSYDEKTRMPVEIPNIGRNQFAELLAEMNMNKGAEIGVEQGEYAEILLKANPNLRYYGIDAWQTYGGYRDHTRQNKLDTFYEITKNRLEQFNRPEHRVNLIRDFSVNASHLFDDASLDFVYIDGNHDFLHATQDIYYWSKKVRKGGIIAGHDYIQRKDGAAHVHVVHVLRGYTESYDIKPWFVRGRDAKIEGEIRDSSRSWMFIKQ